MKRIIIEIDAGEETCDGCADRTIGQFECLECRFGPLTENWILDDPRNWPKTKRLPECIKAELGSSNWKFKDLEDLLAAQRAELKEK